LFSNKVLSNFIKKKKKLVTKMPVFMYDKCGFSKSFFKPQHVHTIGTRVSWYVN